MNTLTTLAGLGMVLGATMYHSSKSKAVKALTEELGLEFGVGPRELPPSKRVLRAIEKHGFVWLDKSGEIR